MEFQSERSVIINLSETMVKAGVSLYNAVKYFYSLADEDFYRCDVKDALRVVLNNITDINCLQELGLRINSDKCAEMNTPEYNKVLALIVYSFAVRIPTLKRIKISDQTLTNDQLKRLYDTVVEKGAENYHEAIPLTYDNVRKLVKGSKPVPSYTAQWYKTYIYRYVPPLAEITNKNIFLLGVVDILFTMFYSCLEEELENIVKRSAI